MTLPIRKRGNFFKDEYFQDFHNDFENAMDKVMDKFGGRSLLADQFSNYRKLKRDNSQVTSLASISDTGDNYIIVLDMSEYLSGSITVCTSGKNAVVEANYEDKNFYKKFPLPKNCNIDSVKSAMSNEGILTINAQKSAPKRIAVSITSDTTEDVPESNSKNGDANLSKIEGGNITVESMNTQQKVEDTLSQSSPSPEIRRLSIDRRGNFFQDSKFENVWDDFEKAMEDMIQKEKMKKNEREIDKLERRSKRDAVFDKLTKQFFEDDFTKRKCGFFDSELKKKEDEFFDRKNRKQKSFQDDLSNLKEKFFGENSNKGKDPFFDEDFTKRKESFGNDSIRKDKQYFNENSQRQRDNLFGDECTKIRDKFFENDSGKWRDSLLERDSASKSEKLFDNASANIKNNIVEEDANFSQVGTDIPKFGCFRKYRNLRNWDPATATQAVSVKQSADNYKILLDVKDVDSNSLSIQAKDDGLLISGGEGRYGFKRMFSLPGAVNFEKVNATLSEDGILIITIPKN